MPAKSVAKLAFRFVLIVGIANLFADMTYEGARSVTGPFLGSLGASAAVVGFVAGFGELFGYALRSASGYFADRTRLYWPLAFVGYAINLLAVPALALAHNWPMAALFIILERTGRGLRKPAMEAMLSHAGHVIGRGWVFGLNEALDQGGATIGPLITSLVLYLRGDYRQAFALFLISALLCLVTLAVAGFLHPRPHEMEPGHAGKKSNPRHARAYWLYVAAGAMIAAGFADFSLVAFHFQKTNVVPRDMVPIFYAAAMATGAIAAPLLGRALDRLGIAAVLGVLFASAFFAPCVFAGGFAWALVGMVLWGLGMAAQNAALKALLAGVVHAGKRSTAFGLYDTVFGLAWFAGSAAMGLLYDHSIPALILLSITLQLLALPILALAHRAASRQVIN